MKIIFIASLLLLSTVSSYAGPKVSVSKMDKLRTRVGTKLKKSIKPIAIFGASTAVVGAVGAGIAYPYFKIDKSTSRLDNSDRMVTKEIPSTEISEVSSQPVKANNL
jgi:hypothetical protein